MKNLAFWNSWKTSQRLAYIFLLGLLGMTLISAIIVYLGNFNLTLDTTLNEYWETSSYKLDTVTKGIVEMPLEGEIFLINEVFDTKALEVNIGFHYYFGILQLVALLFIVTSISMLRRIPFIAGMGVFILMLSTLYLDALEVLGKNNGWFFIICVLSYAGLGVVFQARESLGFGIRLLSFSVLTLVLGFWVAFASPLADPALFLISHSVVLPLIFTLVFVVLTAHEILLALFKMITKQNPLGKNNLTHFAVVSVIYLGNLVLLHRKIAGGWDLGIIYIDVFVLFFISAVLGIWGYRQRAELISKYLPFAPQGAFYYLAMGIVAFSSISFFILQGNDSMMDTISDFTRYAYMGFGASFFLYIVANFKFFYDNKVNMAEEVYNGKAMPYLLVSVLGFFVVFFLFQIDSKFLVYHTRAGFYNSVGDMYYAKKDFRVARSYYEAAMSNDRYSYHPNFALATLAERNKDLDSVLLNLNNTLLRRDNPYTHLKVSNTYVDLERDYNAISELKGNLSKYPSFLPYYNNLMYLYTKVDKPDSALYHYYEGKDLKKSSTLQNNLWAFLSKHARSDYDLDSLPKIDNPKENKVGLINKLALYSQFYKNLVISKPDLPKIKTPDYKAFSYIYNYTLNRLGISDPLVLKQIKAFRKKDKDKVYKGRLDFVEAAYYYYKGSVEKGIQMLTTIRGIKSSSYYNKVLGLWLLEQRDYEAALGYFEKAIELYDYDCIFHKAVTLSEMGKIEEARETWQQVLAQSNKEFNKYARPIMKILRDTTDIGNDMEAFSFIHYKKSFLPKNVLNTVFRKIQNQNYKAHAAADLVETYLEREEVNEAERVYQSLEKTNKIKPHIKSTLNFAYLRLLYQQKKYDELLTAVDKLEFVKTHRHKKSFYKALALREKGNMKSAKTYFMKAFRASPYDEAVVYVTAEFVLNQFRDYKEGYDILVGLVRGGTQSVEILKMYALVSIELGLEFYGEDIVAEDLKDLMEDEAYQEFKVVFEERNRQRREDLFKNPQ